MKRKIIIMAAAMMLTAGAVAGMTGENDVQAKSKKVAISKKNFPDKVFRELVKVNYDKNKDNKLSVKEIKKATSFGTGSRKKSVKIRKSKYSKYQKKYIKDIKSFKGITKLTNLKRFVANDTTVKTVNFSKNKKLTEIEMTDGSLQKLDLNKNKKLKYLYLQYNQLTSLKINKCKKLVDVDLTGHMVKKLKIYYNKKTEVRGEKYYAPFKSTKIKTSFADLNEDGSLDANGNYCIYEWSSDYTRCVKKSLNGSNLTSVNIPLDAAAQRTAKTMQKIGAQWQDAQGNFYFVADKDGSLVNKTVSYIYKVNTQGTIVQTVNVNDWIDYKDSYGNHYAISLLGQKNGVAVLKMITGDELATCILYFDMNKMAVTKQVECNFSPTATEGDTVVGLTSGADSLADTEVIVSKISKGEMVELENKNKIEFVRVSANHQMRIPNREYFKGISVTVNNNYVYLITGEGVFKAKLAADKFTQVYGIGKIAGMRNAESQYTMTMKNEKEMYLLMKNEKDEKISYSLSYNKI